MTVDRRPLPVGSRPLLMEIVDHGATYVQARIAPEGDPADTIDAWLASGAPAGRPRLAWVIDDGMGGREHRWAADWAPHPEHSDPDRQAVIEDEIDARRALTTAGVTILDAAAMERRRQDIAADDARAAVWPASRLPADATYDPWVAAQDDPS